jgi:hypothetical protein
LSGVDPSQELTVDDVRACFEQALEDLEEGRTKDGKRGTLIAKALRNAAQLHTISGREIHFITSAMMKEKFEKPQPIANINSVFSRLLGRPVIVRFWADSEISDSTSIVSSDFLAQAKIGSEQSDQDTDVLLRVATEELGGRIVDKKSNL